MKYLFLLAAITTFSFVSAQNDEVYYLQKQIKKKLGKKITGIPSYQSSIPIQPQKEVAYILPDGNNVSVLPQDNMPCVKPEKQNYNMPVLKGTDKRIVSRRIDFQDGKIVKDRSVIKRF